MFWSEVLFACYKMAQAEGTVGWVLPTQPEHRRCPSPPLALSAPAPVQLGFLQTPVLRHRSWPRHPPICFLSARTGASWNFTEVESCSSILVCPAVCPHVVSQTQGRTNWVTEESRDASKSCRGNLMAEKAAVQTSVENTEQPRNDRGTMSFLSGKMSLTMEKKDQWIKI